MECIFLADALHLFHHHLIKSFDDLKLKQQKFTSTVTGRVVVRTGGVLLLVLLSTSASAVSSTGALA